MKRALLIVGGTLGGLGAVLAITPPQLGTTNSADAPMGGGLPTAAATTGAAPAATASTTAKPGAGATVAPTKTAKPGASGKASTKPSATSKPTASASAAATKPAAPSTQGISGTFTGDPIDISYGIVQVAITVVNGKITDAQAVRVPGSRNDRWTNLAVPVMRERTLAAQSSQITAVSGASYTSFGWYKSLQSALTKAGLPL
jgi:uncharacterized protein with FMN-binding domain